MINEQYTNVKYPLTNLQRVGLLFQQLVSTLGSFDFTLENLLIHTRGRNFRHGATARISQTSKDLANVVVRQTAMVTFSGYTTYRYVDGK
jgi:hypothetical protein